MSDMRLPFQRLSQQLQRTFAYRVTLDAAGIERRIVDFFPWQTGTHSISLSLEKPKVRLNEAENRIHLLTDLVIGLPGQIHASGHVEVAGSLVYQADAGAFLFDKPEICQFSVMSIPSRYMLPLRRIMSKFLARHLTNLPVYSFNQQNLQHRLAKTVLKKVEIKNNKLEIRFSLINAVPEVRH